MSRKKYSWKMLIGSILAGVIYGVVGEALYPLLIENTSSIVTTLIYFTGLFLFLGIAVYLIGKFIYSLTYGAINKRQWIITFLLIIVMSAFFEFLYDLAFTKGGRTEINSYLFLIDNSSSMDANDPEEARYQAIDRILESKTDSFRYGIYSFSDNPQLIRNMGPKSDGTFNGKTVNFGATNIMRLLDKVYNDIENGILTAGDECRIVLLSDGEATDIDLFNKYKCVQLLDKFSAKGISISTVGLKGADDSLMTMIAEKTGGIYINVDDIDQLESGMMEAVKEASSERNLLGYRSDSHAGFILGIMRVLFVAVLGIVIAVQKTVLCEKFLDTLSVLVSSIIGGILAGICIEVGMNLFGVSPVIMRLATCVLIAFTLLREDLFYRKSADTSVRYADIT